MSGWEPGEVRVLPVDAFGLRYRRYRLPDAEAEAAMVRSLERYGQVAPVVVCLREDVPEVLDGFKRLTAARVMPGMRGLSARPLAADERAAKAAIYGLNRGSRPVQELEEAWVVHALVREDGLTQVEAAELLGRDKSWVCRRLALVERLATDWKELKDAFLNDLFHEKCAYRERSLAGSSSLDVEHYRPKKGVTEGRAALAGHPGYFWLGCEWYNLVLACRYCNSAHANRWPDGREATHPGKANFVSTVHRRVREVVNCPKCWSYHFRRHRGG